MNKEFYEEKCKIDVLKEVIKDLEFQKDNYSKLPNQAKAIQMVINREKKRLNWLKSRIESKKRRLEGFDNIGTIILTPLKNMNRPYKIEEGALIVYKGRVYNFKNINANDEEASIYRMDNGVKEEYLLRNVLNELWRLEVFDNNSNFISLDKKQWQKAIDVGYVNSGRDVNYKVVSISDKRDDGSEYSVEFAVCKFESQNEEIKLFDDLNRALHHIKNKNEDKANKFMSELEETLERVKNEENL
jgi:hypothetical protein